MSEEIKRCPICGDKPDLERGLCSWQRDDRFGLECCVTTGIFYESEKAAVQAWNDLEAHEIITSLKNRVEILEAALEPFNSSEKPWTKWFIKSGMSDHQNVDVTLKAGDIRRIVNALSKRGDDAD